MDHQATMTSPVSTSTMFDVVSDLSRYPQWLTIIRSVVAHEDGDTPAWTIELRAKVGPLARSKKLRMVRSVFEPDALVRFERDEADGRTHSPWMLEGRVAPLGDASELTMSLHYGGGLWGPLLEGILAGEVERAKPRLAALLEDQ
jgi:Polyketide cyclase / dehydrase and lipid transport